MTFPAVVRYRRAGAQPLVHVADITNHQGSPLYLEAIDGLATTFPRLCHLWVDSAYQGSFKE